MTHILITKGSFALTRQAKSALCVNTRFWKEAAKSDKIWIKFLEKK